MRIAVATASIGNYDVLQGAPKQVCDGEVDFFYYTEGNMPYPFTNLNNRYKARYLKAQMHRFLPEYDLLIWVDGRIRIEGNNFVQSFLEQATGHDMAIYKHQQRNNIYEELLFIEEQVIKGSKYLVERYADQPIARELLFYTDRGVPKNYPLFMSGIFARWNNDKVNRCFEDWFIRLTEFSNSDQSMLSLCTWEHKLDINVITWDDARSHKLWTLGQHAAALKELKQKEDES